MSGQVRSSRIGDYRDAKENEDMTTSGSPSDGLGHSHAFLAKDHERGERNAWMVIALCTAMMIAEIVGGLMFGSIALVADGFHMSTHAGALLLAALAYTLARRSADDPRFTFGTGKFGDLAGFTSAIILAMIALFIGYESVVALLLAHAHSIRRGDSHRRARTGGERPQRLAAQSGRRRTSSPWTRPSRA